jgi:hypothetical protein
MYLKTLLVFGLMIAIYVQFLGAIYPYSRQLIVLRATNLDSLQSMRFIPQASHLALNHRLFLSHYVAPQTFIYTEQSWFRWTEQGQQDVIFHHSSLLLTPYDVPAVTWWEEGVVWKKITYISIVLLSGASLLFITFIFSIVGFEKNRYNR